MRDKKLSIFISHPSDFLTNYQPHGDGLIAFNFINKLAQRGHTIHIAVHSKDIKGDLPKNIKLYLVPLQTPSRLHSFEYILRVRQLFNNIHQQDKVDIIHQLNPVIRGLSVSLLKTGIPVVLGPFWINWPKDAETPKAKQSLRGTITSSLIEPLLEKFSQQQQANAAALFVSTPAAITQLYRPETNPQKIHQLSPGIDTTLFSPACRQDTRQETPTILFLANLEQRKGIFTLLEAFENVAETLPTCKLTIAGAGAATERVQQQVSTMSCKSQILLLGRVEREEVPELMRQCSVYCLPSYGEPFGMSALEAMACGKPVVATNAGGLAHLVPEQGGRKVAPKDAQALTEALLEILTSPELQQKMGQYNCSIVEATYSWERVIEKLECIYYSVRESRHL
ncbi:MAG: glycosyltransferase family 4 protein [Kastovskya adunca ATA6-11-RM4]|nr:glycosyltransferase family 4 protein [Kastovskya adunca ATA6-11-RM4]